MPGSDSGFPAYPFTSGWLLLDMVRRGIPHHRQEEITMKIFRSGSYATVASTAALVVALGGTSYAAAHITSADIKDGTIQTKDVNKHARVTAKSVKNDNGTLMTGTMKTVLSLNLKKGKYVVNSKASGLGSANGSYASCFLVGPNGNTLDTSWWWAGTAVTGYGTLANEAVVNVGTAGTVQLRCYGGTSALYYKKLTAVKVARISNLTGGDVAKAPKPHSILPKG
jgi:hypothetical protein